MTTRLPRPSAIARILPFALMATTLALWPGRGLVDAPAQALSRTLATIAACAAVSLLAGPLSFACRRAAARTGMPRLASVLAGLRDVVALAAAASLAATALELPWNEQAAAVPQSLRLMELELVALLLATLYFVGQRRGAAPALGVALLGVCGLAQHFVIAFRGSAILPADVLALGTAASVAGGYDYVLDAAALSGIEATAWGVAICLLMRPMACERGASAGDGAPPREKGPMRAMRLPLAPLANLGAAALCAVALVHAVTHPVSAGEVSLRVDPWDPLSSYLAQGFLPSFATALQDMGIERPEGYSEGLAAALEAAYAERHISLRAADEAYASTRQQFDELHPSIVFVMNESFADLSFLEGLGVGYEGPQAFRGVSDALVRGKLAVSAFGGGTCNSEFEALTGNTIALVGGLKYPYALYDLTDVDSLARQLAGLGYDATAIHPNLATNWSRDLAYPQLGIDRFMAIEEFDGSPTLHSGVTDAATYEKVLELLASSERPQFVLDVTMQNHGGYDQGNVAPELLEAHDADYLDEGRRAQLDEYLACVEASDRDLAWFMEELRALERPVALVFFGDHQPSVAEWANDALFGDEDELAHRSRTYLTDYLVWTNYEVEGAGEQREELASASTLAALALDAIGAPLTSQQQALLGLRQNMPAVGYVSYADRDGGLHASGLEPTSELDTTEDLEDAAEQARLAFEALAHIQYRRFAERV